jgi:NAD(P)-dependent dehydrogenase (short-subunit alcohol dehydrogenase family)
VLTRAFLPYKKNGSKIIAYSSGFAFLPASFPALSESSAYSVSKMGTARFYEFLAVENPDLEVFIVQPGVIRTALYEKGKLQLDDTIDTSKLEFPSKHKNQANSSTVQLPAHFSVWLASPEAKPLSGRFLFANWDVGQLNSKVASQLEGDPVFLTTSLGGFPFNR